MPDELGQENSLRQKIMRVNFYSIKKVVISYIQLKVMS